MLNRAVLKKKMEEKGLTQAALGEAIGATQAFIGFILSGRKQPSLALAVDLAAALGCTVDELVVKEAG